MARTPQRIVAKGQLQANISIATYERLAAISQEQELYFSSLSQTIEAILFWAQNVYFTSTGDEFALRLVREKALGILAWRTPAKRPASRRVHATVDTEALDFLTTITSRYPGAFSCRNDAFEQIASYAGNEYGKRPDYFVRRVNEALLLHPFS